ncbi:MAG TPA: AAA family ATPase, partial [candidate division WOR-3 bacterium]|nr:AAA family ATPase [candidate division WOR-3 bacterium]
MADNKFLTPKEIVERLNRYIIGQDEAKKIVAIAIRNRWRRQNVQGPLREEIVPNNIIMIGPTGVGKTEIARRLAQLVKAPFIKVEATKFTEVGYVGKDVESMVRDLVEVSINMVKTEKIKEIEKKAEESAFKRLLEMILPGIGNTPKKDHYLQMLKDGYFDERFVEIDIEKRIPPIMEVISSQGMEEVNFQIPEELEALFPPIKKR